MLRWVEWVITTVDRSWWVIVRVGLSELLLVVGWVAVDRLLDKMIL